MYKYVIKKLNFMSFYIYINLMFYDITKFILCHFILEIH